MKALVSAAALTLGLGSTAYAEEAIGGERAELCVGPGQTAHVTFHRTAGLMVKVQVLFQGRVVETSVPPDDGYKASIHLDGHQNVSMGNKCYFVETFADMEETGWRQVPLYRDNGHRVRMTDCIDKGAAAFDDGTLYVSGAEFSLHGELRCGNKPKRKKNLWEWLTS